MAAIDILIVSYNGVKYIKSQIISIIAQQFSDWRLLVHDDGSMDSTVAITKQLMLIYSHIKHSADEVKSEVRTKLYAPNRECATGHLLDVLRSSTSSCWNYDR